VAGEQEWGQDEKKSGKRGLRNSDEARKRRMAEEGGGVGIWAGPGKQWTSQGTQPVRQSGGSGVV